MTKIERLLSAIGPKGLERFNHLTLATGEDKSKYKDVMDKLQREFAGMKREVFSRYQFRTVKEARVSPLTSNLTNLRLLSQQGMVGCTAGTRGS